MKRINGLYLLGAVAALAMVSCGGRIGGGGYDTPTPAGTAVSMATFKGLMYGTATPGRQMSIKLHGSDSQGNPYTGTYTVVSDGPTTFESQYVTKSRTLVTLQKGSDNPVTVSSSRYYLFSDNTLYKSVSSLGVTSVPTTQSVIPDIIHVGDVHNFLSITNSDGSITTTTWIMEPEYHGNTKFILSAAIKSGDVVTSTEENTYYLDPSGNPYRMKVSLTINGVTINMSGFTIL